MITLDISPDARWLGAQSKLAQCLTVGGHAVDGEVASYIEMYTRTFLDRLRQAGITNEIQLAQVLTSMDRYENVGDFLSEPADEEVELSSFGLLLLDRMAAVAWGKDDPILGFWLHEQLFECFEYVRDGMKRRDTARKAVTARHAATLPAKTFVLREWSANRGAYKENKSAFARDYARRVKHEFDVDVTEKQLREVWLKTSLSTGNPDGSPVDG